MTRHEKNLAMIKCESEGVSAIIRILMAFKMSDYPAEICRLLRNVAIESSHAMYQVRMRQIAMCITGDLGPGALVGMPNGAPVMVNIGSAVISDETIHNAIIGAKVENHD